MERQRRSMRYINSCSSIANIFRAGGDQSDMLALIPKSILPKINQTSSISCDCIAALPPFAPTAHLEEELRACSLAGQYQLAWQPTLESAHSFPEKQADIWHSSPTKETIHPLPQPQTTPSPPKQPPARGRELLWNDDDFLERLNQFIGEEVMHEKPFSTEEFFEK